MGGVEPYAAIVEIVEAKEIKEIAPENPYKIGDIVTRNSICNERILHAYQVIKTTSKTITIQEIEVKDPKQCKVAVRFYTSQACSAC